MNDSAQQNLVNVEQQLVPVQAPSWLHLGKAAPKVLAPKPRFTVKGRSDDAVVADLKKFVDEARQIDSTIACLREREQDLTRS